MSDAEKQTSVTDSPWFWVMLFSLAGLAALFTIAPKFERREASIEAKFHARERGLGREPVDQPPDDDATPAANDGVANDIADGATNDGAGPTAFPWQPIFTITPIALFLAAIAIVAMWNVMRFHRRRLSQLQQSNSARDH